MAQQKEIQENPNPRNHGFGGPRPAIFFLGMAATQTDEGPEHKSYVVYVHGFTLGGPIARKPHHHQDHEGRWADVPHRMR